MKEIDDHNEVLPELRAFIRQKKPVLAGFMAGDTLELADDVLRWAPCGDFDARYLSDNGALIADLASEFFGRPIKVEITGLEGSLNGGPPQTAQSEPAAAESGDDGDDEGATGDDSGDGRTNPNALCIECGHPLAVCWEETSSCWSDKCAVAAKRGAAAQVRLPEEDRQADAAANPPRPKWLRPRLDNIPDELKLRPQWVITEPRLKTDEKSGKREWTKPPLRLDEMELPRFS
jgi:hypothetical protein